MRYVLLMHYREPAGGEISEEAIAAAMEAFGAYGRALEQAGVLLSADVLQPAAATTTVTGREGNTAERQYLQHRRDRANRRSQHRWPENRT